MTTRASLALWHGAVYNGLALYCIVFILYSFCIHAFGFIGIIWTFYGDKKAESPLFFDFYGVLRTRERAYIMGGGVGKT